MHKRAIHLCTPNNDVPGDVTRARLTKQHKDDRHYLPWSTKVFSECDRSPRLRWKPEDFLAV